MSTIGTSGTGIATIPFTTRPPIKKRTVTIPVPATSITMALGVKFPTTARFGFLKSILAGRHIELAGGYGSRIGVGLGFRLSRGAGRHLTMAACYSPAGAVAGGPARA